MARIERSALVPYSAQQMFALVNDVESYPEFMPGCHRAVIRARGDDWMDAELTLGKGGIRQAITTHNTFVEPDSVNMTLVAGPLKSLVGEWRFVEHGGHACEVSLWLEFRFSNPLLAMTASKMFEQVSAQQVDAVCQRAAVVYGEV